MNSTTDAGMKDDFNSENATPITVAHGDGIGPEIMDATLRIILAAGAKLKIEKKMSLKFKKSMLEFCHE